MNYKKKKINEIQDEIINSFLKFKENREEMINYIIDIGKKMKPLEKKYKTEKNIIEGCMSKVWLIYKIEKGKITFKADSNTIITKGMISLLIKILSGQEIDKIINSDLYFIKKIGMNKLIGSQRLNGIGHMIKKIKIISIINKKNIIN